MNENYIDYNQNGLDLGLAITFKALQAYQAKHLLTKKSHFTRKNFEIDFINLGNIQIVRQFSKRRYSWLFNDKLICVKKYSTLKDGNLDGIIQEWYEDGHRSFIGIYSDGSQIGEFVHYHKTLGKKMVHEFCDPLCVDPDISKFSVLQIDEAKRLYYNRPEYWIDFYGVDF
jgi:antitoxin component YwqK of YwqJK toxin-antitoxin module